MVINELFSDGMKYLPRTITKEQDKRMRLLSKKKSRTMSELVRERLIGFDSQLALVDTMCLNPPVRGMFSLDFFYR